ncbi:MAG: hypothetical protein C0506_07580 [Anaerolinea sp.]|nr:hypothetical protein [Anaerolinea sp.]
MTAAASSSGHQPGHPPLGHLLVIDLTTELGALACRFLSGFGATVIRIEPPGGDPLRAREPVVEGKDRKPVSLYWLHLMSGRDCREVDLGTDTGRREFRRLLARADIIIESQPFGRMESLGIDYEAVHADFPRLIWTSITPFGRSGPRAGWAATDLIGLASGGLMSLCGDADRPPLRPSVEQGYAQAGAVAFAATLAALHARNATGLGQLVDVSMQEAIANCLGNSRLFYEFEGVVSRRAGGGRAYGEHGTRLVYPCADGYVAISRTPDTMASLHAWIRETAFEPHWDATEWATLPLSGAGTPGPEKARELEDDLTAFFASGKKLELYERGQRRGIMICPVSTPADLLQNQQLAARGFFVDRFIPELGRTVKVPGAPVRMSRTPWRNESTGSRPEIQEILSPPGRAAGGDSRSILSGIRIADFSWVGVGPIATQLFAGLGAEVIRVESTARLDVFRSGGPRRGASPPDASAYFANVNRDKLGLTLNLSRPAARDVALRLAARSDVLVESFRPGFMASAGLSYEEVSAVNPSIIMISCSMEGAEGPHAGFKGFGLTLQATVGFTHFTGWPDRAPVGTGTAYTDWFATNIAQAAVFAALEHRRRTGEGQYIDLSQLEACIWALDAEVLRFTAAGAVRAAAGNRHLEMTPHGVFPCEGADQWIAIAVRDAHDWSALAALIGDPGLRKPAFLDVAARRAAEDEIEAAIGRWTSTWDKHRLAEQLQTARIPASPVNDVGDVHRDPQLRARGHFWRSSHPVVGEADWDAPAFRLSETPMYPLRPAPLLGQDNERVYREILGFSDDEISELIIAGVIS